MNKQLPGLHQYLLFWLVYHCFCRVQPKTGILQS